MTIPQVLNFHVPKVFKFRMPLTWLRRTARV
jgi:hypothetical protein